jgi:hypothetical protein
VLAQEKEQQWDQEKGQVPANQLAPRFLRASALVWQSGLVSAHWLPPGLESALQSAQGLRLDLGLDLELIPG